MPAAAAASKGDTEVSQAGLLKERGDLFRARLSFDVTLESRCAATENPLRGLGMSLVKSDGHSDGSKSSELRIAAVSDTCRGVPTAVSHWNDRCEKSNQVAHVVRPGDAVCGVDGYTDGDYDELLQILASTSPSRPTHLKVQRESEHLFVPSGSGPIHLDAAACQHHTASQHQDEGEGSNAITRRGSTSSSNVDMEDKHLLDDTAFEFAKGQERRKSVSFSADSTRAPTPVSTVGSHSTCSTADFMDAVMKTQRKLRR